MANRMVGPYALAELVGMGGMGAVYRAEDTRNGASVAIKLIPSRQAEDTDFGARFLREAQFLSRLDHPNIPRVIDYGEIDGQVYLTMPFIEGADAAQLLQREGLFQPIRAIHFIKQVAAAIDAAHAIGIIHRDVKPSNILIKPDGAAVLIDFGVARALSPSEDRPGTIIGTIAYMAPEVLSGQTIDGSVDIYSLGCVLFEFLTGQPPFPIRNAGSVYGIPLQQGPPRLAEITRGLPSELDSVIDRALNNDPKQRYEKAADLANSAEKVILRAQETGAHSAVLTGPPPSSMRVEARSTHGHAIPVPGPALVQRVATLFWPAKNTGGRLFVAPIFVPGALAACLAAIALSILKVPVVFTALFAVLGVVVLLIATRTAIRSKRADISYFSEIRDAEVRELMLRIQADQPRLRLALANTNDLTNGSISFRRDADTIR